MKYQGSCHCGKVKFTAECEPGPALECNCSYCGRKGHLLWFIPQTQFELQSGENDLSTYTFNKHIIKHQFCSTCGCGLFGLAPDPSGKPTAAINVRCLKGVDLNQLERIQYDGRSV